MLIEWLVSFGYFGITAAVFIESGVFAGFFLPGDSLLFSAGVFAAAGIFNIWVLVPLIVAAAVLGDSVGYWFGRRAGAFIHERPESWFFRKSHIERTTRFYEKYGPRTIILARFVPVVRTFAPILAGVGGMKYRTFLTYNIVGGFVWGAGITLGAYFLGSSIPGIEDYLLPITIGIILLSFLPIVRELLRKRVET